MDDDSKAISKCNSHTIQLRENTIQRELDSDIEREHKKQLGGVDVYRREPQYYGAIEGWYNAISQKIPRLENEKEQVRYYRKTLQSHIRAITLSISPYSQVRRIPKSLIDRTIRDEKYDYFQVDFGMNINVPEGKVNEIRFYLTILADGKEGERAQVISGFPNDTIERVTIVGGTIKVGINNLLDIIPEQTDDD